MKHHTSPSEHPLFYTPYTPAYWKEALASLRSTRILTATALLCALCALVDLFFLPIGGAFLRVYFSFLIAGITSAVSGPLLALPAGFLVDTLSFMLSGGDPSGYFPGYAISSMCSFFLYALFFYRAQLSLSRLFLARLSVNVFINVILGSVWKHILYGKAYMVYFVSGAIKNIALLPLEVFVMLMLYRRLVPVLQRAGLLPYAVTLTVAKKDYIISAIASVIGVLVLIGYYSIQN